MLLAPPYTAARAVHHSPELRHLRGLASLLGVRAVASPDEDGPAVLRRILTRPVNLAGDVVDWLHIRGVALDAGCAEQVRGIVESAANADSYLF